MKKSLNLLAAVFAALLFASCGSTSSAKAEQAYLDAEKNWNDNSVPSLYKSYSNYFDHVGIACEYGIHGYNTKELANSEVQLGLSKHANTITMGNEFKPQFICQWWGKKPSIKGSFTASNGLTIATPELKGFNSVDAILNICRMTGLSMRGHVLVWHSQTEDAFFRVDYNPKGKLVDSDTMTARQEWYIKTVIEHVQEWEVKKNKGKKIVWAWDVVNEAVADGSSSLRSQDSNWYKIYQSDEFIVNAFRFANKYANPDVELCYNDYGCTNQLKRNGMLKVLNSIMSAQNDAVLPTRITAMGMQSHISVTTPVSSFQNAVKDFLATGLDVQITELDVATESSYKPETLAYAYYDLFTMFIKNRKTPEKNGISTITIWGINDETTWLNSPDQIKWHGNKTQFPLLFKLNSKGEYVTKPAFDNVIKAAKDFNQ